jgi:endonuclease V-like protein UPF0215 family
MSKIAEYNTDSDFRLRNAISDYLNDIQSEANVIKKLDRVKKLKLEVNKICLPKDTVKTERINEIIIRAQRYSKKTHVKSVQDFIAGIKKQNIENFKSLRK